MLLLALEVRSAPELSAVTWEEPEYHRTSYNKQQVCTLVYELVCHWCEPQNYAKGEAGQAPASAPGGHI